MTEQTKIDILILYSGGLDSFIMYEYAKAKHPTYNIKCVYYDIGHPYAEKEMKALPDFVEIRKLDWLNVEDNTTGKGGLSGNIFIPGRNMLLATAAACQFLPKVIWMGALAGETHEQSTDKNYKFLEHINTTLKYVLRPYYEYAVDDFNTYPSVTFPFADEKWSKKDIVNYALSIGISPDRLMKTSSCLSGGKGNCGKCVVCFRRYGIFAQFCFTEQYNTHPLDVLNNWLIVREMITGTHYDEYRKQEIMPTIMKIFTLLHYIHVDENPPATLIEWVEENIRMLSGDGGMLE